MISSEGNTIPTWGYASSGDARIFDLEPGEALPDGWADTPAAWLDIAAPEIGILVDPPAADLIDSAPASDEAAEQTLTAPTSEPAPAAGEDETPAQADFGDEYLAEIITAEDKEALDAFAAEKGVKLDRRKSFDKMLSDYREAASQ